MQEGMDVYGEYSVMVMVIVIIILSVWVIVLVHSPQHTWLLEVNLSTVFILVYIGEDGNMCSVLYHSHGHGQGLDQVLVLVHS